MSSDQRTNDDEDQAGVRRWSPYRWPLISLALALLLGSVVISVLHHKIAADAAQYEPSAISYSAPPSVRADHAIQSALDRQATALLRGDEHGWLAAVDPAGAKLRADMRRLFRNLRGLEVSGWVPEASSVDAGARAGPVWVTGARIRVCFAGPACAHVEGETSADTDVFDVSTAWRVTGDTAVMTRFVFDTEYGADRPTPWERDTLTFAAGDRVIVAAPRGLAGVRPRDWVAAADRAALVADRFALHQPMPRRYLIFLAGRRQWGAWYSTFEGRDVIGYAVRPSRTSAFVVIDTTRVRPDPAGEVTLRHELGHVATEYGASGYAGQWAVEGLAEYVAWAGRPVSSYNRVVDARRLAAKLHWTGRLDLEWSGPERDTTGYYGMGFFAMRCISERYGEQRMLGFFTKMAYSNMKPALAALSTLNTSWPKVQSACAPTIHGWLKT